MPAADKLDEDPRSPEELRAEQIRGSAQRETVEAFVVAFILALLFRAFIAEAFVIPTGSMAPTLMGAHKDLQCDRCGQPFPVGASLERRGPEMDATVVAGVCPNCRHTNVLDLEGESAHKTFSGDRILVSKFAYALSDPKRWDVIVFKFPGNPKQNYIKRLVGLPEETLTIRHGDVYVRPTAEENARPEILRKPPRRLLAMRHLVNDTAYQADDLILADYPSRWQPWAPGANRPPEDGWRVDRESGNWLALLDPADVASGDVAAGDDAAGDGGRHWIRYFHRWPSEQQWRRAATGESLADVDPFSSRLITDFYAYNSSVSVDAREIYRSVPAERRASRWGRLLGSGYGGGDFRPDYDPEDGLEQFRRISFGSTNTGLDGMHWVGDLMVEADIETGADSREVLLELVEAGVRHRCRIDLRTGAATMEILSDPDDDRMLESFRDAAGVATSQPTASTGWKAGTRRRVRFSNFDDELLLWLDGKLVTFDGPTTFDSRDFRPSAENYPRYGGPESPLDAAPIGIAVAGGSARIHHLRVDRDKYYIATRNSDAGVYDYDLSKLWSLTGRSVSIREIQDVMAAPERWDTFAGWDARRAVTYPLEADQFFPMGDNSPESLDARCWAGTKQQRWGVDEDAYTWSEAWYVPRDLLVGKALLIFWPHPWNRPLPITPNFRRMQLIR